jgi:hypothetical protein
LQAGAVAPHATGAGPFTAGVHMNDALNFVTVRFPNWSVTD